MRRMASLGGVTGSLASHLEVLEATFKQAHQKCTVEGKMAYFFLPAV